MTNGTAAPGILAATIMQLRTLCPLLGGRVAGAADFRLGLRDYNTAPTVLPFAYVLPLGSESSGHGSMTGLYQFVTRTTGVVVEFAAIADRRGQAPAMDTEAMETCLNSALLNWEPVPCLTVGRQGYYLAGARFLDLDRARLFYQWEYGLNTVLTDDDGVQTVCEELKGIQVDYWRTPPQDFPVTPAEGPPPPIITEIDILNGAAPPVPPWPPV